MPIGRVAAVSLAALVALACSSCAWTPHDRSAAVDDDEGYVPTGSHIPRKVSQGADRGVRTMDSQSAHDMIVKPPGTSATSQ
jgi:hypothetical protein